MIYYLKEARKNIGQPTSETMDINKIIEDYPQLVWVQSYEKKVALSVVGMYEIEYLSEQESGYELGLYSNLSIDEEMLETRKFDTEEEAEQFKRERALIKKIKCWAKEQQGDWQPNWNDVYEIKYYISFENNRLSIWRWYTNNLLTKLPCFKSQEIVQACIDEFGDEILEVFF